MIIVHFTIAAGMVCMVKTSVPRIGIKVHRVDKPTENTSDPRDGP